MNQGIPHPGNSDARTDRRTGAIAIALTLILFVIYNLNFRHGSGVDSISSTLLPVSLLREGDFGLDEFRELLDNDTGTLRAGLVFGSIQEVDGHLLGSYPPGAGIMATPVFAAALALGELNSWHDYRVTAKLAASLTVALSVGFLFLILRTWLATSSSLLLALLYGLGTTAWSVVSQDLWQHPAGMLCLTMAIFCFTKIERSPNAIYAAVAGLCLAMAIISRYLNFFPAAALSLYILCRHRRLLVAYFLPLLIIGTAMVCYNFAVYGKLTGGYSAIYTSQWHGWRGWTPENTFSFPFMQGFTSILFSPSKGLFIYSPFLLFGFLAAFSFRLVWRHWLGPYLVLWVLLMLVALSKNVMWWGGSAFGPRYFSELLIALILLIGLIWPEITRRRWALGVFAATAAISLGIQLIGAYFYPCGWEESPRNADRFTERFWDWNDMQIVRCLHAGCENGPLPFEMLHYRPGNPDF